MGNVKFSIIMPAYNVENYIKQAVDSVINQTYDEWELIVVDDGSTDNTWEILKSYKDKRIKTIKSKNQGVSHARNVGLKKATGDYIVFLDSDDYLENWLLKNVNKELKKNDIDVFVGTFNCVKDSPDLKFLRSEILNSKMINNRSKEDVLEYIYNIRLIFTVWRFIVKKSLMDDNNLYFVDKILHEDEDWVTRMLITANKFHCITKPYYNYRIRHNSIMTTNDSYDHFKLKNDSRYRNASSFLELANNYEEKYIKEFLYRCAYKNVQQVYLDIKKKSNPSYPTGRRRNEK